MNHRIARAIARSSNSVACRSPTARKSPGIVAFHEPTPNLNMVVCLGVPPTPCIIGVQNTVRGPEYQVELLSPQVPRLRKGCALWAEEPPKPSDIQ